MSNHKLVHSKTSRGFTLLEVLLAGMVLMVAIVAILGGYVGQMTLNEHARNLSLAINDANRVIEQIRQQNTPCVGTTPAVTAPTSTAGCTGDPLDLIDNWDERLTRCLGGKGISNDPTQERLIESLNSATDPATVTIAVCWLHRGRVIGECNNALAWADNGDGIPQSPAALTTLVTCR